MRRIVALPLLTTGVASLDLQTALQGDLPAAVLPLPREAVAAASEGDGGRAGGVDLPDAADA